MAKNTQPVAAQAAPALPAPDHDAAVAAFVHFLYRGGDSTDEQIKAAAERALHAGSIFAAVSKGG